MRKQLAFSLFSPRLSARIALLLIGLAGSAFLASCKKDEIPGANKPADSGLDLSTPKKAGIAYYTALENGDSETIRQTATGSQERLAEAKDVGEMFLAMKRYEDATVRKFGEIARLAEIARPQLLAGARRSNEKIDGDKAALYDPEFPEHFAPALKKVGGKWKVDLDVQDPAPEAVQLYRNARKTTAAIYATIKKVEAGKFESPAEALLELRESVKE